MRKLATMIMTVAALVMGGNGLMAQTESRSLIYLGAGIEKDFSKKLSAGMDVEGRFCKSQGTQDLLITPSLEYTPIKYIGLGAEYRIGYEHKNDKGGEWSGRLGLMAKAKWNPSILRLEARAKYCNYSEDYEDEGNLQYFRTKFELGLRIKSIRLTPYLSYEWFYNISRSLVDKDRYTIGLKKKLSKRNSVGLEYMLEEKFNRGKNKCDINKNIFALSYQYTLPAAKKKTEETKTNIAKSD